MKSRNVELRLEWLAARIEGAVVTAIEGEDGPLEPSGPWEQKIAKEPPSEEQQKQQKLEQLRMLQRQLHGKKPTVTQLMTVLHLHGLVDKVYTARDFVKNKAPAGWDNETYGPKSMLYYHDNKTSEKLTQMKSVLRKMGIKYSSDWNYGNGLEIPVSYFKGYHWDE